MYLDVLLLSNITTPDGKNIDDAAYHGDKASLASYDTGHKVNQAKPNAKAWAEWKQCLHLLCHRDSAHTLKEPLGPWMVNLQDYNRDWDLLYSITEDAIYRRTPFAFSIHQKIRYDYDRASEEFCKMLPKDAVPIDRKETPHTWILPRRIATQDVPPDAEAPSTISELIETLPLWERMLFHECVLIQPESRVWEELKRKPCIVASDRSAPQD